MKQKLLALGLIALTSGAGAAGVLGTKASFAEGSFCKQVQCKFSEKRTLSDGKTGYGYNSRIGGIVVTRDKNNNVTDAITSLRTGALDTRTQSGNVMFQYIKSYVKYFTGGDIDELDALKCESPDNFVKKFGNKFFVCSEHEGYVIYQVVFKK